MNIFDDLYKDQLHHTIDDIIKYYRYRQRWYLESRFDKSGIDMFNESDIKPLLSPEVVEKIQHLIINFNDPYEINVK